MKLKVLVPCAALVASVATGLAFSQGAIDSHVLPPAPPPEPQSISAMPVLPDEGPQERALDQSLGLPTIPSPHSDAEIEARISADAAHHAPLDVQSNQSDRHFEGPQERALDQSMQQHDDDVQRSMATPTIETPNDIESPEVRRLNGGN